MSPRHIATIARCFALILTSAFILCASSAEAQRPQKIKPPSSQVLFSKGKFGYVNTRIPALIVTKKGTVLAFAEGRVGGDAGRIHTILRRSEDDGDTWSDPQVVWSDGDNTCGNPCPVVDQRTGKIILLGTWNLGSDGESKIIDKKSRDTRRPYMLTSTDDGKTWSKPVELTKTCKEPSWGWYATGPGVGIQLTTGPHKGRLVIPANHSYDAPEGEGVRGRPYGYGSHTLLSDDGGATWRRSEAITPGCNESQVAELADGALLMNMRNYGVTRKTRALSRSADGGATWSPVTNDPALIEPTCQASFLRYSSKPSRLLFSNPGHRDKRVNLTVRLSYDEGATWPVSVTLHPGPSGYSSLTVLPNGDIACLYERGEKRYADTIVFERFSLDRFDKK